LRWKAGDQSAPLGAALSLQPFQQPAVQPLDQRFEFDAERTDRPDFPVGQREGCSPYLGALFPVEIIENSEADEQVGFGEDGVDRQPDRQPLLEFLDPPADRARMIEPFPLGRAGDFGQRDGDNDAVQRLPCTGALQQGEERVPPGTIHRGIGILRRVAAGRVDEHGIFGEPPFAKPGPADAGDRVLPHLGGQRNLSPAFRSAVVLPAPGGPMITYQGCS
jgi:hypothetical protein